MDALFSPWARVASTAPVAGRCRILGTVGGEDLVDDPRESPSSGSLLRSPTTAEHGVGGEDRRGRRCRRRSS